MTRLGIELRSSGPLTNTLTILTNEPVYWSNEESVRQWSGRPRFKTLKMVHDAALLNTHHYKVRIKDKVEQSRKWSSALPYNSV